MTTDDMCIDDGIDQVLQTTLQEAFVRKRLMFARGHVYHWRSIVRLVQDVGPIALVFPNSPRYPLVFCHRPNLAGFGSLWSDNSGLEGDDSASI
jgi:hypothetical protein